MIAPLRLMSLSSTFPSQSLQAVLHLRIVPIQIHKRQKHLFLDLRTSRLSFRLLLRPLPHPTPRNPIPPRTLLRLERLRLPSAKCNATIRIARRRVTTYLRNFVFPHNYGRHKHSHVVLSLSKHIVRRDQELDIAHFEARLFEHFALGTLGERFAVFEMPAGTLHGTYTAQSTPVFTFVHACNTSAQFTYPRRVSLLARP